jgi:hypothetical protein
MPFPSVRAREFHGITVHQFDLCEVESDDTAFLQRDAKDIHVFPCSPTADAKNGALFNRESIDLQVMVASPVARMPDWQTGRQPQSAEMQVKT